jgi:hypothetical protein
MAANMAMAQNGAAPSPVKPARPEVVRPKIAPKPEGIQPPNPAPPGSAKPAATKRRELVMPLLPLPNLLLLPPANSMPLPAPYATKLDLNRATLAQIQALPSVGPGMGAHILAGRPYRTIGDLARNGVPFNTIEKIAPLITLGPNAGP